jgi:DNA repair ATPase RecN
MLSRIKELEREFKSLAEEVSKHQILAKEESERIDVLVKRLDEMEQEIGGIEEAQEIAQHVALATQEELKVRLSDLVSSALQAVFETPYQFEIEFEHKRGGTEARLMFVRDGLEIDPLTEAGGGVVDVASFALRLACILLSRPAVGRTVFLDEPFKFLSRDMQPRAGELLEELSKKLSIQFVLVTHETDLGLDPDVVLG